MLDLNIVFIMGVIVAIFLIALNNAKKQNEARLETVSKYFSFVVDYIKEKNTREDDEEIEEIMLDAYKDQKRVRLYVNGKLLEDLSLNEHEALCGVHGVDPRSPVEFRVELDPDKQGDSILPFPQN